MQLSKEEYARKRIHNGSSVQIENSITWVTVRHRSASLVKLNSYPHGGIFNQHLTTIKDSYNPHCLVIGIIHIQRYTMPCETRSDSKPNAYIEDIWAPSSEFVSSSIPSWQILTAHAQPFRGARDLVFCLKVPLDSVLVWASSEGSGETARMRRLTWTFAARIGDKYQIRLTRSI